MCIVFLRRRGRAEIKISGALLGFALDCYSADGVAPALQVSASRMQRSRRLLPRPAAAAQISATSGVCQRCWPGDQCMNGCPTFMVTPSRCKRLLAQHAAKSLPEPVCYLLRSFLELRKVANPSLTQPGGVVVCPRPGRRCRLALRRFVGVALCVYSHINHPTIAAKRMA